MRTVSVLALALGLASLAPAQSKVGIINIQAAIINTRDGQKAAQELQTKTEPRRKVLEGKRSEIAQLNDQLQKGSNTMSAEGREKLQRDIEQKTRVFNRDAEDAEAEFNQDQQRLLGEIAGRMQAVIDKYASDNGYSMILDISSQQTPVVFAASSSDVTKDVIALYDKNVAPAGTGGAPGPGAAAPKPAAPAAAKPATPMAPKPGAPK